MSFFEFLIRLTRRAIRFTAVGVGTLILDLCILWVLVWVIGIHFALALAFSFAVSISINYYLAYHWVYRGTEQTFSRGYIYFVLFGIGAGACIIAATSFLVAQFGVDLLAARIAVSIVGGIISFFWNTFCNFRHV